MSNAQNIYLFYKANNKLGEGVLYDSASNSVYWVDMPCQKICKLDASRQYSEIEIGEEPGFLVTVKNGGLIVGAGKKILLMNDNIVVGEVPLLCENLDVSVNDGSISPDGKTILFGTKHNSEIEKVGESFVIGDAIVRTDQRFIVFNGPAFSLDGNQVYFTDSPTGIIKVADYDQLTGRLSRVEEFARVPEVDGYPDGMAIDSEGYLWSAHWDGARITRYQPDGTVNKVYKMPVKRPTSLAFTGSELKTLIVTSADLDDPIRPRLPNVIQDGDVLALDVDVPGVVLPAYTGSFLQDLKKSNDKL